MDTVGAESSRTVSSAGPPPSAEPTTDASALPEVSSVAGHHTPVSFVEAAKKGDLAQLKILLKYDPGLVFSKDAKGDTAVKWAALREHREMFDLLLASNAECTVYEAAAMGALEKVKVLLKDDPTLVCGFDQKGYMAIQWAAYRGHKEVVELLLANGAECTLLVAAAIGDLEKTRAILKENTELVFGKDAAGGTPLEYAAYWGHKEVAELLLANGANVNARNNDGTTVLNTAAYQGHKEIVELLLANGADVRAKEGYAPLDCAVSQGHKEVVKLLLDRGADVNANVRGKFQKADYKFPLPPLISAVSQGHREMAALLLANGADANAVDSFGHTPLYYALSHGHRDITNLLLANGADGAEDEQPRVPELERLLNDRGIVDVSIHAIDLLMRAYSWGEVRGFGATWMKDSPQYAELRDLGSSVNNRYGLNGMIAVIQLARRHYRRGYNLDHFWDGIGEWHA